MISITNLHAGYGALAVLFGIELKVARGDCLALIGANGAGKSTLFSTLSGLLDAQQGDIQFDGQSIIGLSPVTIVQRGLIVVPEGRRLFASLSVEENLLLGKNSKRQGNWTLERIYDLFPTLGPLRHRNAMALSGGQQQLVAIGRALMSNPLALLCDELSLGLSPAAVDVVYEALKTIRREGLTTIIVEQDIGRALSSSDNFACIRHGQIALAGRSDQVDRSAISAAYFGTH
ncbi:ABC transporter ATP-binding protein [Devosia sp. FKR38]|uniref:ABC transporter ATP-binding protein n=1 Tax=Devosia sp. FKR38 TaxID=2562312 RepID=UPI0010C08CF1|nr:ABC transporter ATP-binding protein [Devosia sp. FKR38]